MDALIGLVGKDYVLVAASRSVARSIVLMKNDEDRLLTLDKHKILGHVGEPGDSVQFCDFIQKNIAFYAFKNGIPLDTEAAAHYTRNELATALRSKPYSTNLLLGGCSPTEQPSLYFIDYLSSMHKVNYAAHGYAGYFVLSILDKYYQEGLNLDEGVDLIKLCIKELQLRFLVNSPNYIVKVVTAEGIRVLEL